MLVFGLVTWFLTISIRDGIPYDQWLQDFDAIGGVRVHSVKDF
jgi:hypothetical protein